MKIIPKFFGQYLRDKKVISNIQLNKAVNFQCENLNRIGEIGIEKGYLTPKQASEINYCQRRLDIKFGEFAVAMRFLTDSQLDELLFIQEDNHIFLGEALVKLGFIDSYKKEKELGFFHKEQAVFESFESIFTRTVGDNKKVFSVLDNTIKAFRRICSIKAKVGFLSSEKSTIKNLYATSVVPLRGYEDFKFFLNLPREISIKIAEGITEKIPEEINDEDINRSVDEFCDIVCWVVKADLLEIGKRINIGEPEYFLKSSNPSIIVDGDEELLEFPSVTPEGCFGVGIIRKR
ncbi:hypothetical protein JXI42_07760 [bacterium]|nr:hypothetical protein [bacterium]